MGKGRDVNLITTRNRRIFERYYYWTEVERLRFDDALKRLSTEEFFLSESRIMQIIRGMIRAGMTVDGNKIEKPMFTGFRKKPRMTRAPRQSSPFREGQLFVYP